MILPDSRCEEHGEPFVLYHTISRGQPVVRKYCRACRRKKPHELKYNSPYNPRCKNGHPKDRFHYGLYGSKKQCITCAKERGRMKRN